MGRGGGGRGGDQTGEAWLKGEKGDGAGFHEKKLQHRQTGAEANSHRPTGATTQKHRRADADTLIHRHTDTLNICGTRELT